MRKICSCVIILLLGCFNAQSDKEIPISNEQSNTPEKGNEDFSSFLLRFSYDSVFQKSRIIFPFEDCHLDDNLDSTICITLGQKEWKHVALFDPKATYYTQIYDNKNHTLADTNERIFAYLGIENGIEIYYYFQLRNGLWYLVKREDLST